MKIQTLIAIFFLLVHGATLSALDAAPKNAIESRFSTLDAYVIETLPERVIEGKHADVRIHEKYDELGFDEFSSSLDELTDEELTYLMRAAWLVVHELPHSGLAARMSEVFEVLRHRDAVEGPHIRTMYRAWVRIKEFDQANELKADFPEITLTALPEILEGDDLSASDRRVLRVHPTEHSVVREGADWDSGKKVIVAASPNCGWVDMAARDIFSNAELAAFFQERALWLATGEESLLQIESIRSWNDRFPTDMRIVESPEKWPILKHRSTPTFYVLEDGIVIETLRGWEPETQTRIRQIVSRVLAESA